MENIEILGLVAATLTTVAFVPQVYKTWKNKSVKDISLSMYTVLLMGLLLWIVYGFYINSLPIIAANIITATLSVLIVITKIEYK
ncbi:SemiSWEET family sugar transporter [Maribacter arcticus]|uniref:MtN3 and saliva related transmembrane protein n=1 Tax=Maribacter arcticus TaxID=561365 RepID=A0A1T5A8I6_9FLAO|nr:SemiSWEET transporter [Maribacter arcticus]SKB31240.1 MtN3 and saliva related transmembrane protein [Maribacter arcticus]